MTLPHKATDLKPPQMLDGGAGGVPSTRCASRQADGTPNPGETTAAPMPICPDKNRCGGQTSKTTDPKETGQVKGMSKGHSNSYPAQLQTRNERLDQLGFASYRAYLESDLWAAAKRRLTRSGRKRKCYICSTARRLDVHHRSYQRIGKERAADLIYLCRDCHQRVHAGIGQGQLGGTLWSAAKRLKTGKPYRMPGRKGAARRA